MDQGIRQGAQRGNATQKTHPAQPRKQNSFSRNTAQGTAHRRRAPAGQGRARGLPAPEPKRMGSHRPRFTRNPKRPARTPPRGRHRRRFRQCRSRARPFPGPPRTLPASRGPRTARSNALHRPARDHTDPHRLQRNLARLEPSPFSNGHLGPFSRGFSWDPLERHQRPPRRTWRVEPSGPRRPVPLPLPGQSHDRPGKSQCKTRRCQAT